MNFRRSSGSITSDSCATHFDHLATAHGIVHPSRALRQLQKAGRAGKNDATFASALRQGLILECEACVRWDGAKLQARQRTASLVHSDVLRRMEAVLLAASAPPFSTYVNTRDNAFCHVAGQMADHVAGHGFSPPALLRAQTLLPLQADQLEWIIMPNTTKSDQQPQLWPAFDGCLWRGGNTGWHRVQSAFNVNRTTCMQTQTDRQCVVNRHMPKASLMCRKRKCPATTADRQAIERSQCMLAVDGNSYATIFSRIMLAGRLAVRVGGWDAATQRRLSSFEWYEPLLVAGKHYISTSVDDLGVAIEWIASRPDAWRRRVALKGQAAIQALLAERSILCYVLLATDLAAIRSPASTSVVCPLVQPGKAKYVKGAPR